MQVENLIEFLDAAVQTKYIDGPFDDRGGVMLVAAPGNLKTTIINAACNHHIDVLSCSDLNVQSFNKMHHDFVSRRYTCLAFPEYEKIYERQKSTAMNLEGTFKALVCEGWGTGANGDQRMPKMRATGLIIGGITPDCLERRFDRWQKNGFLRRFLWSMFSVANQDAIMEAIRKWQKIGFGKLLVRPVLGTIPVNLTLQQSTYLEMLIKEQPGIAGTGYVLMKKIAAVLLWKYDNDFTKVQEILDDVAPSLSRDGAVLRLPTK